MALGSRWHKVFVIGEKNKVVDLILILLRKEKEVD